MADHPGVHLVGSVAMADAESVFRALAGGLGPWLRRIPDGETGARHRWIYWQYEMLTQHPDMEIDPTIEPMPLYQWDGALIRTIPQVRFRPGVDPSAVVFETGYAPAAIESYGIFRRLRATGLIADGVRFQVSLPTAMASGFMYVSPAARADYLPAYERALFRALDDILAAIPHTDLSIQWDICQEVLVFENYFTPRPADYKAQIFAEFARLAARVPDAVELGYHLCYGSPRDEHLVMPKDTTILAEMSEGLVRSLPRRLDFLHLPVPRERSDDAYFAPLRGLKLPAETTLYLGLIHHDDAVGDQARIAVAKKAVPRFGLASECGWGRTDPARVPGLIAAHRRAAESLAL